MRHAPLLNIHLRPRALLWTLLSLLGLFTILGFLGRYSQYYISGDPFRLLRLFAMDAEGNVPIWIATVLQLLCALLLALVARRHRRPYALSWYGLAVVFTLLSIDEVFAAHKILFPTLRSALQISERDGYSSWVALVGIVLIVAILIYLPFVLRLPGSTRRRFLLAGILYVTGAILLEVGGEFYGIQNGFGSVPHLLISSLEELLEMAGLAVFLYALLQYITRISRFLAFAVILPEDMS